MKRDLVGLARQKYDLIVVGAGIYGISVARDAALRGLSVALLDQGDFGHATSSNHHKIIHGGLRYLQHGDLKRMRESIRERSILFRIAPHLVHPLPFVLPTYKDRPQDKLLLSMAVKLNDLISLDRNRYLERDRRIPNGRVLSRAECLGFCPGLDQPALTGGVLFYDGQVRSPERLNLSLLLSAAHAGAHAANYVQAVAFSHERDGSVSITARDVLSGDCFALRAPVVVNCAGPWLDRFLGSSALQRRIKFLKALVLVTRPLVESVAVGVPSRFAYEDRDAVVKKGFRYLFVTPWQNSSLIGTFQTPYNGASESTAVSEQEITDSIREVNEAFPAASLTRQDVRSVLSGLVPMAEHGDGAGDVQLEKHYRIWDHGLESGPQGLISVMGVKYTTARGVAERAVDLIFKKLGRQPVRCTTAETPVEGGAIGCPEELFRRALDEKKQTGIGSEPLRHLVQTYGTEYRKVLDYCEREPSWSFPVTRNSPVIRAQVLHGVRAEMAQKLGDVIFRRTDLGVAGHPGDDGLDACARIMAAELGWDGQRVSQEVREVQSLFRTEQA
jgi:glycerol-3-phosphate dehydrogenase